MRIHEYQAKALLAQYGVPVPRGKNVSTPEEAHAAAAELGGSVVIKAQIQAGGRGLAGGIRKAESPDEAQAVAARLLGTRLVTHQTGPGGSLVGSVLVEETVAAQREIYLGVTLDRGSALPVVMASTAGGVEIEEVAAQHPEQILRQPVDPVIGLQPFLGRQLAFGLGLSGVAVGQAVNLIAGLYRLYREKDCSLAEINPLVVTAEEKLLALDAKLNFDDNALFRHADIRALRDVEEENPLEREAADLGISYVKLDGNVGCMVNGAGLAMATMDLIKQAGGEPANFLDVGGGASADQVTNAFRILLADPNVRAVLVNIFGGIARGDVIAEGIVEASRRVNITVPVVVRLVGTNAAEGMSLLDRSGLGVITAATLQEAAAKAVQASKPGTRNREPNR